MRTWLVVLVVVFVACGKKKEEAPKTEPPPAQKTEAPPPKKEEAPPPKQEEATKPDSPAAPALDCATLLTSDEASKACGGAKLEVAVTNLEGKIKVKEEQCRFGIKTGGEKYGSTMVQVFDYQTPASAEGMVKLEKLPETKAVESGWTTVKENKDLKMTMNTAGMQKGRYLVKVQFDKSSLTPKQPCTIEQMFEITKTVAGKLP